MTRGRGSSGAEVSVNRVRHLLPRLFKNKQHIAVSSETMLSYYNILLAYDMIMIS